ncbi:Death on curing protein, Doc toxin [Candidatus Nitrosotalea sp. TS]|nr:Death on curing protein, Doc toxin [Candidatus Nitrosotalea sp. TS]NHI03672.1 Death on curing protein, Doc toxin [Candidatus Nitrosotalea sp. TS]
MQEFLLTKTPVSAKRAGQAIIKNIRLLKSNPQIGRQVEGMLPEFRELIIQFGDSGYVALYHYAGDVVTVLTIRHQKEAGH